MIEFVLDDGTIVTGANFENASYGLSLCAETVALAKASNSGQLRHVMEMGVIGGKIDSIGNLTGTELVHPCGRCRQVLNEVAQLGGTDPAVLCVGADEIVETTLAALLPMAFGPASLG